MDIERGKDGSDNTDKNMPEKIRKNCANLTYMQEKSQNLFVKIIHFTDIV